MVSLFAVVHQCYCDYDFKISRDEDFVKTNDEDMIVVSSLTSTRQYHIHVLLTYETITALIDWYKSTSSLEYLNGYISRMNGSDYDESYNSVQSRHKTIYAKCTAIKGSYDEELECSVTVKNDDSFFDDQGIIHTWLIIDGKEGTRLTRMLFSFSKNDIWDVNGL